MQNNSVVVSQISLTPETPEQVAIELALRKVKLDPSRASGVICRRSIDARKAGRIKKVYSVLITPKEGGEGALHKVLSRVVDQKNIRLYTPPIPEEIIRGDKMLNCPPVVVGFGPSGMFAALVLARAGLRPIVFERGSAIEKRAKAVEHFWQTGELDEGTNVQFGEGGAGTFSDGKLVTRIGDSRCNDVLETFVRNGAPKDILTDAKPHVGTDKLRVIVASIREEIIKLGGTVHFDTPVIGIVYDNKLKGIVTKNGTTPCEVAVVAIGHSARDTALSLLDSGISLEKKPFSVGFRIEHTQREIDEIFYGSMAGHKHLPPAEYQLSHRVGERACYTFCMCPGGVVVPSSSESMGVVTNGMSYSGRAGVASNAAVVASVLPSDIIGGVRESIEFQRKLEMAAYGDGYSAPCGSAANFSGINGGKVSVTPTYARGVREMALDGLLPPFAEDMLKAGLARFEGLRNGFTSKGLLTGVETRTSAPWRMPRVDMIAEGMEGIYPSGEGAGYAGGIMSAAVDGMRSAEAILEKYKGVAE